MCSVCNDAGRFALCPACREREGAGNFPFRRDGVIWGRLLSFTFDIYKQNFGLVTKVVATGLCGLALLHGLSLLSSVFSDNVALMGLSWITVVILQMLFQAVYTLGAIGISLRLVRGEPAQYGMLLDGMKRIGALIVQSLVTNTALMLTMIVAIAPCGAFLFGIAPTPVSIGLCALSALLGGAVFIYLALGFTFSTMELMLDPTIDPIKAIKNAWAIARGARLAIAFGWFIAAALMIAGGAMCFIGLFFTLGYAGLLLTTLYLALRNGAALER